MISADALHVRNRRAVATGNPGDGFGETLGAGGYLSFPNVIGNGTLFALNDTFAIHGKLEEGRQSAFFYGLRLGDRTFKPGDTLSYTYLLMRWPVGMPLEAGLEARMSSPATTPPSSSASSSAPTAGRSRRPHPRLEPKLESRPGAGVKLHR